MRGTHTYPMSARYSAGGVSGVPVVSGRSLRGLSRGLGELGYTGGMYPSMSPTNPTRLAPNPYDDALKAEVELFQQIADLGGLHKLCCPSNYTYEKPPYLVMPPQGRNFQQISSIALPTNDGNDYPVVSFEVPTGYDGVITSIVNFWTSGTLIEGSGDILWRLKVGRAWARNLGQIDTTLGSLTSPCPLFRGGLRLYTQQTVTYYVNIPVASGLTGGNIVCAVFGWFYPI